MITVEINEWSSLCREFKSFFIDLGHVMENSDFIQFKSFKENVATGFSISKKGTFAASMPLHGLEGKALTCLLYTSPSPRDGLLSRMPSSA